MTWISVPAPDEIIRLFLVCKLFVSSLHICLHWFASIWRLTSSTRSALSLCWKRNPSLFGSFWELAWLHHKVWTKQWFAVLFACKQNRFLPQRGEFILDTTLAMFWLLVWSHRVSGCDSERCTYLILHCANVGFTPKWVNVTAGDMIVSCLQQNDSESNVWKSRSVDIQQLLGRGPPQDCVSPHWQQGCQWGYCFVCMTRKKKSNSTKSGRYPGSPCIKSFKRAVLMKCWPVCSDASRHSSDHNYVTA